MTHSTKNEEMNEKLSTKNLSSHLSNNSDPKSEISLGSGEQIKLQGRSYIVYEKRKLTLQEASRIYDELLKAETSGKARST